MAYTAEQVARAARRQAEVARARPEARRLLDGELTMQVDPVLFHNARIQNEKVYGVRNVWEEKEFRDDMARRHPEITVRSRGKMVVALGRQPVPERSTARRVLTRLGWAERRAYG